MSPGAPGRGTGAQTYPLMLVLQSEHFHFCLYYFSCFGQDSPWIKECVHLKRNVRKHLTYVNYCLIMGSGVMSRFQHMLWILTTWIKIPVPWLCDFKEVPFLRFLIVISQYLAPILECLWRINKKIPKHTEQCPANDVYSTTSSHFYCLPRIRYQWRQVLQWPFLHRTGAPEPGSAQQEEGIFFSQARSDK